MSGAVSRAKMRALRDWENGDTTKAARAAEAKARGQYLGRALHEARWAARQGQQMPLPL